MHLLQHRQRMGRLQRRNDPLGTGEAIGCLESLVVVDGYDLLAPFFGQVGMQRSYSRVVQPGGDRIRLQDLPVFGLHHQRTRPVDDPFASQTDRRRGTPAVDPLPAGFGRDEPHRRTVDEMVESPRRVAPAAYAGDDIIGLLPTLLLQQLAAYLLGDD